MKTTSIAGSPAASTASPPLRLRRCDTQVRLLTFRDSPICIPMAPFPPAGHLDTAGGRSAWGLAGPHSRNGNGSRRPLFGGARAPLTRGGGPPLTIEGGFSIPFVAAVFIPRRSFTDTRGTLSVREGGPPGEF